MPVFTHPDPNNYENSTQTMNNLQYEKYTWFVGEIFFKKYFMVIDERPHIESR